MGLSPAWQLLFSWPPGLAQLPSLPLGVEEEERGPLFSFHHHFSWWTQGPACPWKPRAGTPWHSAHEGLNRTPLSRVPHELGVRGEVPLAAEPRLAPALGHLRPLLRLRPWGRAEPWLPLPSGCCGARPAPGEMLRQLSWAVLRDVRKLYNLS